MSGARLLVVDDEPAILRSLRVNLEGRGYAVTTADSGEQALAAFAARRPDVIVLDLLMPGIDGIEVTRRVRESSSVPIIVLSAVDAVAQKITALELGADDYVSKPFDMEELFARIRSVLRRSAGARTAEPVFATGSLSVNFATREVRLEGEIVKLTPTEYDLLKYMIEHAGRVLTHQMLLTTVWGQAHADQAQYLRVFVGQLRKKIEKDRARPRYIITEPGVGYRFRLDDGAG